MNIDIAFLPTEIEGHDVSNSVCIMLDIFRASSTIVTALSNGCPKIIPVSTIEEARSVAMTMAPVLLAGERKSVRIEGFDFGNSPREFSADRVTGSPIVMTTTNGTRAILTTAGAVHSFVGSFLNASAICRQVELIGKDVWIVCAGTDGLFSLEDVLCAGLLAKRLAARGDSPLSDKVQASILLFDQAKHALAQIAGCSRNGRRLQDIGLAVDVDYCLQLDVIDLVAEYVMGKIIQVGVC